MIESILVYIMISLCLIIGIIIFLCTLKAGRTYHSIEESLKKPYEAYCTKCGKDFVWKEKDALGKYSNGKEYKVACPFCNHIMRLYK